MNFSIFDLYQSEYIQPLPSLHLSCSFSHLKPNREETPDSMKWENESETGESKKEAEESGLAGKKRWKKGTKARLRYSLLALSKPVQAIPVLQPEPSESPIKSKRLEEIHSYAENKKYWDWMNSRNRSQLGPCPPSSKKPRSQCIPHYPTSSQISCSLDPSFKSQPKPTSRFSIHLQLQKAVSEFQLPAAGVKRLPLKISESEVSLEIPQKTLLLPRRTAKIGVRQQTLPFPLLKIKARYRKTV